MSESQNELLFLNATCNERYACFAGRVRGNGDVCVGVGVGGEVGRVHDGSSWFSSKCTALEVDLSQARKTYSVCRRVGAHV